MKHDEARRTPVLTLAACLLTTVSACGGPAQPDAAWSSRPFGNADQAAATGLRLVTYNAGLAHGVVALAEERAALLPSELEQTGADILCLNEVWNDDDYQSLRGALEGSYPYAFRQLTEDSSWATLQCLPWTVWRLDSCVKSSCTANGISAEECVRGPCKPRYDDLSDGCKICLAAHADSPLSCVLWGAKDFGFEGRNGLALLSKLPLEDAQYQEFDAAMVKRGAITATVNGTRVVCTHLSSDLVVVPYPEGGSFSSWREEQAAQIDQITPADGRCTVLMGDLNTGPAVADITAEVPASYQALRDRGWEEPWSAPRCTFCTENPLAGSPSDLWLDHVMFRGCADLGSPSYHRVMERTIEIAGGSKSLSTRQSDHYGLGVDL